MPPLESFGSRAEYAVHTSTRPDPILRFREKMNKPKNPYRKFNSRRQYQSLDDNHSSDSEDHDDLQSFSSLRLARDQDKPTKKYLGTWKKKNQVRASYLSNNGFTSLDDYPNVNKKQVLSQKRSTTLDDKGDIPLTIPIVRNSSKKSKDGLLSYLSASVEASKNSKEEDWSPGLIETTAPKENRHPQQQQNFLSCNACIADVDGEDDLGNTRPALRALNVPDWSGISEAEAAALEADGSQDQLVVALQLVRLKKELKKMKQVTTPKGRSPATKDEVESVTPKLSKSMSAKKSVRFCDPLVTSVEERPFTEEEDMDKLYFVYGELEELEWDRSTVENDQFECILEEENQEAFIEVEHTSRKLHVLSPGELPHSMSDLSFY